jgi:DNA-binding FrmR family transcriptional regulator
MRIDAHAADRIDDTIGHWRGGVIASGVGMRVMIHATAQYPLRRQHALAVDTPRGYIAAMRQEAKSSCLKRLRRIEGQVRGLARMVEADRYCIDIVTQISAVRAALRRAEEEILEDHVGHCVEHAIASGNKREQRQKVNELISVLSRSDR